MTFIILEFIFNIQMKTQNNLERLKFLIKKKSFVDKWRNKALQYILHDVGPKLSNELDYYLIEDYYQVIRQLNEPFQPCMNHFDKYNEMFVLLTITHVRVINIIRKVLGTVSAYNRNKMDIQQIKDV